ncbi:class I SAM-dependent methyltransferase [Pseudemcibacter aquimaris]|uniref:class I SAM-dependent methyltransferase n=1 Tax=Pseudemcibacter aquimaris TaxID=2857064 RepID=UPI0020119E83|nr:class I SAM-dependent methyltransferase [Pseudemcibacter aquimaris]WDU59453.1 class I SAM-dependent methyltransferase [Pseudemcibacter aquimaris]
MAEKNKPLVVDFVGGAVGHRFRQGGGRSQALPKAIGFKAGIIPNVVDATAGLGRDAFLLASLGATVTMVERNEDMYQHLLDGMERARKENDEYRDIMDRLTLIHGDAKEIIPTLNPEIILVDPMHPERKKSALVKKEMRIIRDLVGTDPDAKELMEVALHHASKRVVLKWPMKADPIEDLRKPSHQITGKTTRYDVFIRS